MNTFNAGKLVTKVTKNKLITLGLNFVENIRHQNRLKK